MLEFHAYTDWPLQPNADHLDDPLCHSLRVTTNELIVNKPFQNLPHSLPNSLLKQLISNKLAIADLDPQFDQQNNGILCASIFES